jgi:hypothetical protein
MQDWRTWKGEVEDSGCSGGIMEERFVVVDFYFMVIDWQYVVSGYF